MEELQQDNVTRNEDIAGLANSQISSSEESDTLRHSKSNLIESGSSVNESASRKRIFKRLTRFSDSDSDTEKKQNEDILKSDNSQHKYFLQSDDGENDTVVHKNPPNKSRIQNNRNLSGSEDSGSDNTNKNKEQQMRMKNKRNKLRNKFKTLITSREKERSPTNIEKEVNRQSGNGSSNDSGEEMASIEKIKQKIKERMSFKPSICDPDTSDEESSPKKPVYKQKKERKMTKTTSPKPQRMSAKQAMENMQKIKSESNRMLREKEVSLPYHRPKAISLKDILSQRKLAVSSDGKALPIKMNEQQLRQYAQMLEERQKEMMELCKSESEEEQETNNNPVENEKCTTANEINNINLDGVGPIQIANVINTETNDNTLLQDVCTGNAEAKGSTDKNADQLLKEQNSETSMLLVSNDSANSIIDDQLTIHVEEAVSSILVAVNKEVVAIPKYTEVRTISTDIVHENENIHESSLQINTEVDSQLISLHFDTENTDNSISKEKLTENATIVLDENIEIPENNLESNLNSQDEEEIGKNEDIEVDNEFSDDDINIADIDNIIENAEIIKDIEDKVNSQFLVRDKPLNLNPKLTGSPGMVIDLDDSDAVPKKSGIELLKERFTYFSKLKTPEEMEREREKKLKPGTQLNKLKQELEEIIAEQRSLEWAKRLEDEKQQHKALKELRGEESEEDDIDKMEAAIEDKQEIREEPEESENEEEEPIEDDVEIKDKPRVKNAMVDDEAEESDCDENEDNNENDHGVEQNENDGIDADNDDDDEENESESDGSDESSDSEDEQPSTTKKGRILKAFEDSDEEDTPRSNDHSVVEIKEVKEQVESKSGSSGAIFNFMSSQIASQDEELQLAQRTKSTSDDLFTSQDSVLLASDAKEHSKDIAESDETFTQTFSIILDSSKQSTAELDLNSSNKLSVVGATQSLNINNIDDVAVMCTVNNSQQLPLPSQIPTTQLSQSQPIGEDLLALCTGQFYNNVFVSQIQDQIPLGDSQKYDAFDNYPSQDSQEEANISDALIPSSIINGKIKESATIIIEPKETDNFIELNGIEENKENRKHKMVDDNLKSILDELADPEFNSPKPNKFFVGGKNKNTQEDMPNENQVKKKFFIDSDDETSKADESKKSKKLKKKKPEKRALQISDDEEELSKQEEIEEYESDIEEDNPERLVEYDSEENEIEVKPQNPKKKRKMTEFFENEAELTSEDEWVGSGDEDEAGLDRMEREEGDDETFHQGKLQRELGQIHMRDVLDQDKREVRLIQELLFEDGDLGGGGRQRKFRWNNMDGGEETGTVPDDLADTQEEEFESEEQWRKQRHERDIFLRQMQNKDDPEESLNVSVNRTTIIKANLLSRTMSSLLMEVNSSTNEKIESPAVEKKTAKDVPSPIKPFALQQPSYQGSLLSRGRGALARLAALATPLAADDDTKVGTLGPSSRRNFVFAALTPKDREPKVTKRKAESNPSTPKLVKKMRTEEKQNNSKSSLLDHFIL